MPDESYPQITLFLGRPVKYWHELQSRMESIQPDAARYEKLLVDVYDLRAKVAAYDSLIEELIQIRRR